MDVFRQRLKDEHEINAIMTQPTVSYLVMTINAHKTKNREEIPTEIQALIPDLQAGSEDTMLTRVDNPTEAPKTELIKYWRESLVLATIITPREF